jgi:hypothetical protein
MLLLLHLQVQLIRQPCRLRLLLHLLLLVLRQLLLLLLHLSKWC